MHVAHKGIVRGVLIDGLNQQIITASSDKTVKVAFESNYYSIL